MVHTFLSDRVPPFSPHYITSEQLHKLICLSKVVTLKGDEASVLDSSAQDTQAVDNDVEDIEIKVENLQFATADEIEWEPEKVSKYLYKKGQVSSTFYLVLSGKVELDIGRDGIRSEYGAFTYLGCPALLESIYVPDFTAKITTTTKLLKIKHKDYMRFSRFRA